MEQSKNSDNEMRIKKNLKNDMTLNSLVHKRSYIFFFTFLIYSLMFLNSCDSKKEFTKDDLIGTWYIDDNAYRENSKSELAENIQKKYCTDEDPSNSGCKIMTFYADGSFEQSLGGFKKGKWQIEDRKNIVIYYEDGYKVSTPHLFTLDNFQIDERRAYVYGMICVILNFGESSECIPAYLGQ